VPVEKLPFSKANVLFGDKQLPRGGIVVVLVKFLLIIVVVKDEGVDVIDVIVVIVVMCLLYPMCKYQSRNIIIRKIPITK
jgi:hypothetical protein